MADGTNVLWKTPIPGLGLGGAVRFLGQVPNREVAQLQGAADLFVLSYLLGYPRVRNYDGSWTEWGNLVGAPVARST